MRLRRRSSRVIILLLLALGVQSWLVLGEGIFRSPTVALMALALAVAPLVPRVGPAVDRLLRPLRHPTSRGRAITALTLSCLAGGYLYVTAASQGRTFLPKSHDEFMYLLQARMLSVGGLWMPPHPVGAFFESFYVFVEPVYASLCWPGTSLLYVPGVWLGWPHWVVPLIAASAAVGLAYSVVTQLVDGVAGAVAALALLALRQFRVESIQSQAQIPILLLALLLTWAWLKWRRSPRPGMAVLIGILAGWAAITRPVDAICLAVPLGVAVLLRLRRPTRRAAVASLAAMCVGAAPFLALQLLFDRGVTGSFFKSPFQLYNDLDQPLLRFGFPKYDQTIPLKTQLAQKRDMYRTVVLPAAQQHTIERVPSRLLHEQVPLTLRTTLPHPLLMILIPAGLMAGFARGRYVVWGVLPLFTLLYACYTLFLPHYSLVAAPAVILLVVLGLRAIEAAWPGRAAGATLGVTLLCASALPQLDRRQDDNPIETPTMDFSMRTLPTIVQRPALVLFRYEPGDNFHEEPVYNIETANPDDAQIIRAHDLGPEKNRSILEYYARRDPQRHVYLVRRADLSWRYLGTAGELAKGSGP